MAVNKDVSLTAVSLVAEILSAAQFPGSSILQRSVDSAFEKRKKSAIDELISAISLSGPDNVKFGEEDADELVQMLLRYGKAASEGAARQNLKLLALAICGLKTNNTLIFDEFQECANVLETLIRSEIIFMGKYYRYILANPEENRLLKFLDGVEDTDLRRDTEATAAALQRHGLMYPLSVFGATDYMATPKFRKICKLASMEKITQP